MSNIVEAAGIVIFARTDPISLLLLKHRSRWDLPKGHAEKGEDIRQTALRETHEETGISSELIELDDSFQYVIEYDVSGKKRGDYRKRVTYFLGFVDSQLDIQLTEHRSYRWWNWPTGHIQQQTIDPLLEAIEAHFERSS